MPPRHALPDDHPDNLNRQVYRPPNELHFDGVTEDGDPAFAQSGFFDDQTDGLSVTAPSRAAVEPTIEPLDIDLREGHGHPKHEAPPGRVHRVGRFVGRLAFTGAATAAITAITDILKGRSAQ